MPSQGAEYRRFAARERITYTVMVPRMYNLCSCSGCRALRLASWRLGGFFGGDADADRHDREVNARDSDLGLMNCYGRPETTSPSTLMPGELTLPLIDSVACRLSGRCKSSLRTRVRPRLPRGEIGGRSDRPAVRLKGY